MKAPRKIFITGLPRTGTTSICQAMLDLGFKVAHTAYSAEARSCAEVIADTPIFCDFEVLSKQYPEAKFVHLTRDSALWLPSIKQLLNRMFKNVTRTDGGFNPTLKRCYQSVFSPLTRDNINSDQFLSSIYQQHYHAVLNCFKEQPNRLLVIDVAQPESFTQLLSFLAIDSAPISGFKQVNIGGKITYWNSIKHINKVDSNLK
ncbi:sulfotransferase family protein [Thalassotalea sp. LPB0316]|uniref:sulfotransferase n=1 Tax=Thalassotalea sp. LPB0316 TaxID=2769490 RepID=UPI001866797B|nr:sulfotransferase [Thalassotalea sp. LPB0316]QOL25315.1 sulfotransferase family protein [Thalassotalea sp. LPB0316]